MRKKHRLWKVLDAGNRSMHSSTYQWTPGEWTERTDNLVPSERGWHLCRDDDLLHWLGPNIWLVELAPDAIVIEQEDKVVTSGPVRLVEQSPWDDCAARLFAVECTVDALKLTGVTDERLWAACEVAFRYAVGDATDKERVAARAALREPLRKSLRWTRRTRAWTAAWTASLDAAWDVAQTVAAGAARDAKWAGARAHQTRRLLWWMGVRDA